jgi:hypothetical protein
VLFSRWLWFWGNSHSSITHLTSLTIKKKVTPKDRFPRFPSISPLSHSPSLQSPFSDSPSCSRFGRTQNPTIPRIRCRRRDRPRHIRRPPPSRLRCRPTRARRFFYPRSLQPRTTQCPSRNREWTQEIAEATVERHLRQIKQRHLPPGNVAGL